MNVFLPQELDARAELMNLSTTMHNIMSSQSTKNIICITQDSLLGSYLLTKDDTDLGRDMFFDICMKGDNWSSTFILERLEHIKKIMKLHNKNYPIYCGKSLFSMMFPKNFNYTKKNDVRKDEPIVKIVKGVLIEGALAKANLGQAHNSIIHVLHKEYNMEHAIDFINNCQFISNQYLIHKGFSIGIKDCVAEAGLAEKTEDIAYKCFIEAKTTETTISHERIRELKIISILDKARDMSMVLAKSKLKPDNAFVSTVTSGSKGEYFNITQITSMLGQQMHMNKRIQKTLNRGKRTLPHYPMDNLTIEQEFESQGFIKHSFLHGLNPQEFIWHAVSGREGCSNTSLQSVVFDTDIVIIENGKLLYIKIGEWIDNIMKNNQHKIVNKECLETELLELENENKTYVPTMTYEGKVFWSEITAITRHNPTDKMYKIKTYGGREIIVTGSKSLLIWNKKTERFNEVFTSEIVVGDYLPSTLNLSKPPVYINNNDISDTSDISDINIDWISFDDNKIKEMLSKIHTYKGNQENVNIFAMLCSRIGIYGKIEKIDELYIFTKIYDNIQKNDVILDEIVQIDEVDPKLYPKVYDLTIPSTFNFGLANGLQIRDTANSGYIQRKMVKVLEDVQVKYDGTVRNTNNWVVQWSYGGDGFDREKCSFLPSTGNVFFTDVSRIADRLNNDFELKEDE